MRVFRSTTPAKSGTCPLPGNVLVQKQIEGFLLKGDAVAAGTMCPYVGTETEIVKLPATGAAFRAGVSESETVLTPSGPLTLAQAVAQELVQVVADGARTTVVMSSSKSLSLQVTGSRLAVRVQQIKSAPKGTAGLAAGSKFFGPFSGTLTIGSSGSVTKHGKALKASRAIKTPHTRAVLTRAGRFYVVRLVAARTAGFAGTYVEIRQSQGPSLPSAVEADQGTPAASDVRKRQCARHLGASRDGPPAARQVGVQRL